MSRRPRKAEPIEGPTERVSLRGLDPEEALRALLKVDPKSEPVERDEKPTKRNPDADKPK
jgi:hypothetical protein